EQECPRRSRPLARGCSVREGAPREEDAPALRGHHPRERVEAREPCRWFRGSVSHFVTSPCTCRRIGRVARRRESSTYHGSARPAARNQKTLGHQAKE